MYKQLITGLILFAAFSAQAEIYKWVDENGKVQYGDQPPPAANKQKLKVTAPQGVTPAAQQQTKVIENAAAGKQTAEDAAIDQKNKEIAAKNCAIANTKLDHSKNTHVVMDKDSNGNPIKLSDAAASEWKLQMQKDRDHWCELANK